MARLLLSACDATTRFVCEQTSRKIASLTQNGTSVGIGTWRVSAVATFIRAQRDDPLESTEHKDGAMQRQLFVPNTHSSRTTNDAVACVGASDPNESEMTTAY